MSTKKMMVKMMVMMRWLRIARKSTEMRHVLCGSHFGNGACLGCQTALETDHYLDKRREEGEKVPSLISRDGGTLSQT